MTPNQLAETQSRFEAGHAQHVIQGRDNCDPMISQSDAMAPSRPAASGTPLRIDPIRDPDFGNAGRLAAPKPRI